MTTDHEQLLEMRRLLKRAHHIGRQVRAQLMQFDTPRAKEERIRLDLLNYQTEDAAGYLEAHILPDAEAEPIELADLFEEEDDE